MKPLSERDPFRIGIVAIVIGGLIGLAILVLSVVCFGTTTYTAVIEHTAGLRKARTSRSTASPSVGSPASS